MVDLYGKEEIKAFVDELEENLNFLDSAIIALESDPSDKENLREIFRVAHTVKGSAGFLALENLVSLGHAMESVFLQFERGDRPVDKNVIDTLLECKDAISTIGKALAQGKETKDIEVGHLVKRVNDFLNDKSTLVKKMPAESVEKNSEGMSSDSNALFDDTDIVENTYLIRVIISENEIVPAVRSFLIHKKISDIGEVVRQKPDQEHFDSEEFAKTNREVRYWVTTDYNKNEIPKLIRVDLVEKIEALDMKDVQERIQEKQNEAKSGAKKEIILDDQDLTDNVRIPVARLDKLLNLVGELVIANSGFLQIQEDIRQKKDLERLQRGVRDRVKELFRISGDIQELVMRSRMVPIAQVFSRFKRFVRDFVSKTGKKVALQIQGEETEIDKKIIDEIFKPLTHLVRNSMDHGIEFPDERREKGKPEIGTLKLMAFQEGNYINIVIEDDGQGLNYSKILDRAIKNGLIKEEDAGALSEQEISNFIFRPGFSTKDTVDDLSGRGIGMDIVRASVEALNGIIDITSFVDVGTKMTLKLPLTLSILNALIIQVGTERFSIPMNSIIETQKISSTQIITVEGDEMVKLRDSLIPLIRLNEVFEIPARHDLNLEEMPVVIVESSDTYIALLADEFLTRQEMVIKSLAEHYRTIEGISGASILGDGNIILIVDVQGIIQIFRSQKDRQKPVESFATAFSDSHLLKTDLESILYVQPKSETKNEENFLSPDELLPFYSSGDGSILREVLNEENEYIENPAPNDGDSYVQRGVAMEHVMDPEKMKRLAQLFDKNNHEMLLEWLKLGNQRAVAGLNALTGRSNIRVGKSRARKVSMDKFHKIFSKAAHGPTKIDFTLQMLPINGSLHFILERENAEKTVQLLFDRANISDLPVTDLEPIMEVTNIIGSAYTNSLTAITRVVIEPGLPKIVEGIEKIQFEIESRLAQKNYSILYIENQFLWDETEILAELLIMMPEFT